MIWKLITLLGAGFALWSFARRAFGAVEKAAPAPGRPGAENYARCPACGAWTAAGAACACRLPPTP